MLPLKHGLSAAPHPHQQSLKRIRIPPQGGPPLVESLDPGQPLAGPSPTPGPTGALGGSSGNVPRTPALGTPIGVLSRQDATVAPADDAMVVLSINSQSISSDDGGSDEESDEIDSGSMDDGSRAPSASPVPPRRASAKGPMSREWCYTHNNPTDDHLRRFRRLRPGHPSRINYHVFQIEKGKSGTQHFQGYIIFEVRKRLDTVKALFKEIGCSPHLEPRLKTSTPLAAANYCKDPSKRDPDYAGFLFEKGAIPEDLAVGQGARTDILEIRNAILEGQSPTILLGDDRFFGTVFRMWKSFDRLYGIVQRNANLVRKAPAVLALFGASRCGKSDVLARIANQSSIYYLPVGSSGTLWFNDYDPAVHDTLAINEFSGSMLPLGEFLRFFDGTPLIVNTKGGQVPFLFRKIIITANAHPKQWYNFFLADGVTPNPEGPRHPYEALWLRLQCIFEYLKTEGPDAYNPTAPALGAHSFAVCRRGSPEFHPDVRNKVYKYLEDWQGDKVYVVPHLMESADREENDVWWDSV